MKTYTITVERMIAHWERLPLTIEAESPEDAEREALRVSKHSKDDAWDHYEDVEHAHRVIGVENVTPCIRCKHPESQHESYEYRKDKPRYCLADDCECKRFDSTS